MPIRPSKDKTFYTRHGDIFAYLSVIVTLGLILICALLGKLQA